MITLNNITAAFYSLRRAKGYVTTIVLTLGITLGALVAMFNLNYQILATPLPYPDQERLYLLKGDGLLNGVIDLPNMYPYPAVIAAYKNSTGHFEKSALVYFTSNIIRNFPDTPRVNVTYITPEYLQLANSAVVLGRTFSSSEGLDSYAPVAVISYNTWQTTFNKSPDILGKNLRFGEVDFRIIGVTAENFIEPELMNPGRMTQVWLPWDYNTVEPRYRFWGYFQNNQYFVGKLKPGIDPVQVAQKITAQLNTFYNENLAGQRSFDGSRLGFELLTYRAAIVGNTSSALLLLVAGALVLVLIAATNITNLMLARAVNQQYTMAIQIALGAQKKHLFNNLLTEVLLLMSLVILVGLAVAFGSISLLKSVASDQLPRINELVISWQSLVFTILTTLLLALAFTHSISRHMNYRSLNNLLQRSGKGAGIQIPVNIRQLLILLQVALTGILLIVSLQILNQAWRNIIQPLGFTTDDNYQVVLNTGTQLEAPIDERKANLFSIRSALHAHPKIANASLTSDFPMSSSSITPWFSYLSEDVDFKQQKQALAILIDEDYPDILDLVWLSGRHFTADEFQTKAHYIIVNETFARRLQPDGKVLNKKYYWLNSDNRQTPYEIIAVVKNFNLSAAEDEARMFIPSAAVQYPRFLLQLKPGQNITAIELNELMAKVNSQYKVAELRSMNDAHQHIVSGDKVAAWLTLSLAIIAFCLAAIGIYGVLSYSVQLRQFELGIRMAIGARPTSIFIKILTDNLKPVVLGLMASLIAAVGLYLWSQHTRYNLQVNLWSWLLPITLMLALTAATSLMSVWYIIRRPASFALKGN